MIRPLVQKCLLFFAHLSLWNWVAVIFGLQVLGSLFIITLLGLALREMIFPILVLISGACVAFLFGRHEHAGRTAPWKLWLPVLLYALFIFLLSHMSFQDVQVTFNGNSFHPLEFGTLGFLLSFLWCHSIKERSALKAFPLVFASGLGYALIDEFHQFFIPGRSPSLLDVALDSFGLCLGFGAFLIVRALQARVRNHQIPGESGKGGMSGRKLQNGPVDNQSKQAC